MRPVLHHPARTVLVAACLGLTASLGGGRGIADTQTFRLAAQWNLISFQVVPDKPEPAAVFGTIPGFISAWGYDGTSGLWQRYVRPEGATAEPEDTRRANQLLSLPPIQPGRGYWVQVEAPTDWSVDGTPPRGLDFPSLELDPGWQLIGIPVGEAQVEIQEPVSLLAVLSAAGLDYDALVTWDQSYRKMFRPQGGEDHPLAGLPPDPPFPGFQLQEDLGRGYWVHVIDPAVLRPRLVTTVRPDMDIPPRGNFPSKEDQNVSGAASPAEMKTVKTQDVIRFFPGEDVQTIGIANLAEGENASGGILLWEAVWEPVTDKSTPEPWIRIFGSRDQRERRDATGMLEGDYTRLSGVTTIENDLLYLRLDRKNLGRGVHEGQLTLRTTVGDRTFRVIAEVPGIEGDFSGYAVIHTVNGRRNPVPDLDLPITLYEDPLVPGLLRGAIDSSRALLWPVDVPLIGHRSADAGNRFLLGGSFVLPPGDQNGEPFDKWSEDPTQGAGEDADWLNDGTLDVRNPFPFPVQRTVLLDGSLTSGNPTDGYVIEGTYREVVHGMSRVPIEMEGSFHLDRQAARPFSLRRGIGSDTGVEPVVMTNKPAARSIAPGQRLTSAVNVATELALRSVQVTAELSGASGALTHSNLVLTLRSPGPGGKDLLLYDGSTPASAISAGELAKINFPLDRPPAGDLDFFLDLPRTVSDAGNSQFWELLIENRGSEAVTLVRWSLRLEGQPVTDVAGVVKEGDSPLAGAVVSLDGLPVSLNSAPSDAEGRFVLRRVPLLPLNFTARRPGYAPPPTGAGLERAFTTPFEARAADSPEDFTPFEKQLMARFNPLAGAPPPALGVPGFDAGGGEHPFELRLEREGSSGLPNPAILASPIETFAGATVEFAALNWAGTFRWELGEYTFSNEPFVSRVYPDPGVYDVKLFTPEGAPEPSATVRVVMRATPGLTGGNDGTNFVFQAFQSSGGVATADISPKSEFEAHELNEQGAVLVARMPLQHAYCASMDIDLAPAIQPPASDWKFADDGFDTQVNSDLGFRNEDFDYALPRDLWEGTKTVEGQTEYPDLDAQNAPIVWGNPLETPKLNYASAEAKDRNGKSFEVSENDDVYNAHPGTSTFPDLEPHSVITHYRIACHVGAQIATASTPATAIRAAKVRRGAPADAFAPALSPAPAGLSGNLYYRLHLTPLPFE